MTRFEADHTNRDIEGHQRDNVMLLQKGLGKAWVIPGVGIILTPWYGTEALDSGAMV